MSEMLQLKDGNKLAYDVRGEGEPLLLVMGISRPAADWTDGFIDRLASTYKCITYDHRGCGQSDDPPPGITIQSMVEDAIELMDHLGLKSVDVMGLSMGGMISQRLAATNPGRVRRLLLLSTAPGSPNDVPAQPEVLGGLTDPKAGRDAIERLVELITAPGFAERDGQGFKSIVDTIETNPTQYNVMAAQFQAVVADDRFKLLPQIKARTLVVTGEADALIPGENSTILKDNIPGAELRTIAECGHLANVEKPDELAAIVLEFFQGD